MSQPMHSKLANVKLLVLDVDGVLTDGRLIYGANGEIGKAYNVKDGYGLRQLLNHHVHVAAISGRRSEGAAIRLSELGFEHIFLGCKDKIAQLSKLQSALNIDVSETAVMGDDVPDLAMMELAALSIAPGDAVKKVRAYVDWETTALGGQGAVREVCDALIDARTDSDFTT